MPHNYSLVSQVIVLELFCYVLLCLVDVLCSFLLKEEVFEIAEDLLSHSLAYENKIVETALLVCRRVYRGLRSLAALWQVWSILICEASYWGMAAIAWVVFLMRDISLSAVKLPRRRSFTRGIPFLLVFLSILGKLICIGAQRFICFFWLILSFCVMWVRLHRLHIDQRLSRLNVSRCWHCLTLRA